MVPKFALPIFVQQLNDISLQACLTKTVTFCLTILKKATFQHNVLDETDTFHFEFTIDTYSLLRKTSYHTYCCNEVVSTLGHSHQDRHQSLCCTCRCLCNVHTAVGSHCRSDHQSKLWQRKKRNQFSFFLFFVFRLPAVETSPAISLQKCHLLFISPNRYGYLHQKNVPHLQIRTFPSNLPKHQVNNCVLPDLVEEGTQQPELDKD